VSLSFAKNPHHSRVSIQDIQDQ